MEFFPASPSSPLSLQGATLVVPAVAQGNVGELAVDILIVSLGATLVGCLEDPNVLPCVGNDPFNLSNPGSLTTPLELFQVPSPSGAAASSSAAAGRPAVFLLQQRAPAMLGRQAEYAEDLVEWAQAQGAAQLIVLSALDSTLCKDRQIQGQQTRFSADSAPHLASAAEAQGVAQLEEEYLADERKAHSLLQPWPLLAAAARRGLPRLLLGCFAAEGDNVPHATAVARCLMGVLRDELGQGAGAAGGAGEGGAPVLRMPCSFAALYGKTSGMDAFLG